MADLSLAAFATISATLFVTELTDKDSLLLIAVSTRVKATLAFAAGASAFLLTTTIIVGAGSLLTAVVPVSWVKLAGGVIMLGYGLWEARGLSGAREAEREDSRLAKSGSPWKVYLALVAALALLDLAGDATEVLTVVLVARYGAPLFVFASVYVGLLSAAAAETALGNRLGRVLTPRRLRVGAAVIFIVLGLTVIFLGSIW